MWEDAGVNLTQEAKLLQHLRMHFGKKTFATRRKTQMLCEGHTHVFTDKVKHAYEEGEADEILESSYKDIELEVATQIARRLEGRKIDITSVTIDRVDLITGGDHGQGAF